MGRLVRIRATYTRDITSLSRLKDSIERNPKHVDGWKKKASKLIEDLMLMLLRPNEPPT